MLNLNSIQLDLTGWKQYQAKEFEAIWFDSDQDVLMISFFNAQPDIPPLGKGTTELRHFFRQGALAQSAGIVQVDVVQIHQIAGVSLIIKAPQTPTGFSYQGTLVIPRQNFSFVIRVQCLERGTTGSREAAIMLVEKNNLSIEAAEEEYVDHPIFGGVLKTAEIQGWRKDPYEAQFDDRALFTLADQEKYDPPFPHHPLSRARQKLNHIINTIQFNPEIFQARFW